MNMQRGIRMGGYQIVLVGLASALISTVASAQQPTRRRQSPIEIRGQVPTPQVVTVRPREVPAYSREVLTPRFYNHDFWPEIQTGYQLVPQRQISGNAVVDSVSTTEGDSTALPVGVPNFFPDSAARARRLMPVTAASDSTGMKKEPLMPAAPADSAAARRRPKGTGPARPSR